MKTVLIVAELILALSRSVFCQISVNLTIGPGKIVKQSRSTVSVDSGASLHLEWKATSCSNKLLLNDVPVTTNGSVDFVAYRPQKIQFRDASVKDCRWSATIRSPTRPHISEPLHDVKMFYVTDRQRTGNSGCAFTKFRNDSGATFKDHRLAAAYTTGLPRAKIACDEPAVGGIGALLRDEHPKRVILFVHGFNVPFSDALDTAAELLVHLQVPDSVGLLYSWPSQGNALGYTIDGSTTQWTMLHFLSTLEDISGAAPDAEVDIVAHSMGSRVVAAALLLGAYANLSFNVKHVVFLQADIDGRVLQDDWSKVNERGIRGIAFVYRKDKILGLSRILNAFAPAGLDQSLTPLAVFDASHLHIKFPGHSYYSKNPEVHAAIRCFLNEEDRSNTSKSCPNLVPSTRGTDQFGFITR